MSGEDILDEWADQLRSPAARLAMRDERSEFALLDLADALTERRHGRARRLCLDIDGYEAHSFAPHDSPSRQAISRVLGEVSRRLQAAS